MYSNFFSNVFIKTKNTHTYRSENFCSPVDKHLSLIRPLHIQNSPEKHISIRSIELSEKYFEHKLFFPCICLSERT